MNYPKRTSGAQLPSAPELWHILKKESQRLAMRFDYLDLHPEIFDAHMKLSQLAGSDDSWLVNYKKLELEEIDRQLVRNHNELKQYIFAHPEQSERYEEIYTSLIPEQILEKSDAIFVFGSPSDARIDRAVELYKQGIADRIIISGQGPHYRVNDQSEASRMAMRAESRGVPAEAIIIEEQAITIPDNVKRTIDLLISRDFKPKSLTIVATDCILQRAKMDWYKFVPWEMNILPVGVEAQAVGFTKEGWYKDESTTSVVLNEYAKLIFESKIDLLRQKGIDHDSSELVQ
jgi:hypothetical protein